MKKRNFTIETDASATLAEAVEAARADDSALSDIALARVGHRLFSAKVTLPQRRDLFGLRFATLLLMLLLGSAVGAAATLLTLRVVAPELGSASPAMEVTALPGSKKNVRAIRNTPIAPAIAEIPAIEAVAPSPAEPAPTEIARPNRAWVPATRPVAPQETAVTREARQLADALDRLRRDHRPKDALTALDAYLRENPNGTFTDEAHMARAEALAATGDRMRAIGELKALAARKPAMREKLNKLIDSL
jgi:hypothetical protein